MSTTSHTSLRDLIARRGHALFDGAMGTMLQSSGLEAGEVAELWNVERPDAVAAIHRGYAEAGAVVLTTNTFGGSRPRLEASGLGDRVAELNAAGAGIARAVADEFGILVAGDLGPTGELIEPLGTLSQASARAAFAEQAEALADGGADLILAETLSDLSEAEAAVLGARDGAPGLEVVVTLSFDTNRHTMMGISPARAVAALGALGVTAVGANCGRGLEDVEAVMADMAAHRPPGLMLAAQSNAGMPVVRGDEFHYDVTPEQMAAYAARMRALDVELVGGCCGSTPAHLAAMSATLAGDPTLGV